MALLEYFHRILYSLLMAKKATYVKLLDLKISLFLVGVLSRDDDWILGPLLLYRDQD